MAAIIESHFLSKMGAAPPLAWLSLAYIWPAFLFGDGWGGSWRGGGRAVPVLMCAPIVPEIRGEVGVGGKGAGLKPAGTSLYKKHMRDPALVRMEFFPFSVQ